MQMYGSFFWGGWCHIIYWPLFKFRFDGVVETYFTHWRASAQLVVNRDRCAECCSFLRFYSIVVVVRWFILARMPRTQKVFKDHHSTTIWGNIFKLFQPPADPSANLRERKTTHLIVKQLRTIVATSRFRWKSFIMGRFDLENFQARWSEKNPGSTPEKITIQPKNGGLVQVIFCFNWVISRFHVKFQGSTLEKPIKPGHGNTGQGKEMSR